MDSHLAVHRFGGPVSRRLLGTSALYLIFLCGGLWNSLKGSSQLLSNLTAIVFIAVALTAFFLTYKLTVRSVAAASGVVLMTFVAEVSGVNAGFPFGGYAYTSALGPKLMDVPLAIPFLWLGVLITSWIAAERFLRYKHIVVAAIVATAFDAVLEFSADSLDLWHWQAGMPTELNYVSWFAISYLGLSVLKRYALEKEAASLVPHLLIVQLLYFAISDVGIRYLSPSV